MMLTRLASLRSAILCLGLPLLGVIAASGPAFAQQAQQPAAQPPKPAPAKNPFEVVPLGTDAPKPEPPKPSPEPPKLLAPGAAPTVAAANSDRPPEDIIEAIEFRGARRVPQDTLRALIFTKRGDVYDEESLRRDFLALWNTSRFDDIRMEREAGRSGWIVRFVVVERRVIRSIKYDGLKSLTQSEVLDRWKERHVGLSVEAQYDPNKVQHAVNVISEYLAERGRQFAKVTPEVRQIPPSALEVTFKVDEGPKVKVNQIDILGNQAFSDKVVTRAMKNLHPIGVPHSLIAESIFPKTYDSTKLEEDQDRIRQFYQDSGYFTAHTTDAKVEIVDIGGGKFRLPLIWSNKPGKGANININVEEGRKYKLNNITVVGSTVFREPDVLVKGVFGMRQGDTFSTAKLRKGFEELRKVYGQFGYIDFVSEPAFEPVPNSDKIDLTLNFDEGKQFFVRRIDFSGNTTTRDKVIRRELLIDEGDFYNTRLWEMSILRLNQLGYFETLKENEAADIKRDTRTNTVDLTLKVKERGKNTVQLSGGVSGISGSFLSFGYSTNNFLGLGETLSLNSQLGTRVRSVNIGFTEPYLFDRPLQAGVNVFMSRFNYNQAREASVLSGTNLIPLYNNLGTQNLLNYVTNSRGFSVFGSYPLRRSFARLGLTYTYSIQNVRTLTDAATQYYDYINFLHINGPNQLDGIKTSGVTMTYTYNTVNHPITPTAGKSLTVSTMFAGSILGGTVNQIEPTIEARYFHHAWNPKHIIGVRLLGRYVTGYGGKVAPPFNRFYMGGENDVRGFQLWGVSPIAYVPTSNNVPLLNPDGSPRQQKYTDPTTGASTLQSVTTPIPAYQMVFPGGDTNFVGNFEYRIPIFGPVTLAIFADGGLNKLTSSKQLQLNADRATTLNTAFPEAGFPARAIIASGTQALRTSTGLELQVLMPVVNAPFRIYWAYNPNLVREYIQPPFVADRSYFPNQASFIGAASLYGQAQPFFEKHSLFRFTVGRTF